MNDIQFTRQMANAMPAKAGVGHIFILDDTSWHKATHFNWHHHFEPRSLEGYSLDFNPIERLSGLVDALRQV